ncbi:MAG: WYL domain-containing protein [Ruminiclostridium sp.]|nr:WYL domain-containing protein [Ruminiclostridium sp.]
MPRSSGQKLKLLYLADIFRYETDEEHPLSVKQLIAMLEARGVSAERKAIYTDIEALRDEYGMDICEIRAGNETKHFLASGVFELAELQLLADAVACSKFITQKKSRELISKIETLTSRHQANVLQRNVIIANRAKTINESVYYNIHTIHEAINKGRKITFRYFRHNLRKQKVYKYDGERYEMSPYTLAWDDEKYYCIGHYDRRGKITNLRVDRMENICISDETALKDKSFNISEYTKKVFGMFPGEMIRAKLVFDNALLDNVMDKFGMDIVFHKEDDQHFSVSREVSMSPTFYAWMFQFGEKAKIEGPDRLIDAYKKYLKTVLKSIK